MFKIDTDKVVEALRPFGPTPIVATVLGIGAFAALSFGANPVAVVIVNILALGAHIYGQERKAELRRKELEVDFDASLRNNGQGIVGRLERRLKELTRARDLFGEESDE
ncbi:MAG: hypothetical protein ACREDD_12630 [Methylocella sp.]